VLQNPDKQTIPFSDLQFLDPHGNYQSVKWEDYCLQKFILGTKVSLLAVALRVVGFRLAKIRSSQQAIPNLGLIKKILQGMSIFFLIPLEKHAEELTPIVAVMKVDKLFKSFPNDETKALPTVGGLVELSGYVTLDDSGKPNGPFMVVSLRPRLGPRGKIYPSFLAPQSDFDRVGLRCLFTSTHTRVVFKIYPKDDKPRMGVVHIEDSPQLQDICDFSLKGLFATPKALKEMDVEMIGIAPLWVPALSVNWNNAVMEGTWRLPDYR
jgi:hypothetical protein